MTFDGKVIPFCPCKLFSFYISIKLNVKVISYLMFIRYCASATDSAFPVIVMVRSIFVLFPLTFGSRSSQFDMRIIAPLSCLQVQNDINGMHQTINSTSKLQSFRNLFQSNAIKYLFIKFEKKSYLISAIFDPPLPMMHPMSSLGTVISCVCCVVCGLPC